MTKKEMTFGSLFAGIGGLDLGFERAGMKCKWQVEIDEYCQRVLEKHWPDVSRWRDVRTFPPEPIDEWKVDVICGGFPCQDISYAGRGKGIEGDRSGLFFEAVRVVRQLRPRCVVLENVAALLTRGLDRVHGELAALGYCSESHCIPAAAVGAPHIRDRVFILAYAKRNRGEPRRTECKGQQRTTPLVSDSCNVADAPSQFGHDGNDSGVLAGRFTPGGCGGIDGGAWAVEPDVGRVAHGVPARVDRLKGLGNAVVPQVAEWIGQEIMEFDNVQ